MSVWSYVKGWVECQPLGKTQEEKAYILKTVLNHLPVVQGSEEDMHVHIIKAAGYNFSCSCDEYGYRTNNLIEEMYFNKRRTRNYGFLRTQDTYFLFVEGYFRDRYFNKTFKQIVKWITRLAKRVNVSYANLLIYDSNDNKTEIITDRFSDLFESPSWLWDKMARYDDFKYISPYQGYNSNWCEHLMWEEE